MSLNVNPQDIRIVKVLPPRQASSARSKRPLTSCAPQLMSAVPSTCGAKRAWSGCSEGSWRCMATMGASITTCVLLRWHTTWWTLIRLGSGRSGRMRGGESPIADQDKENGRSGEGERVKG